MRRARDQVEKGTGTGPSVRPDEGPDAVRCLLCDRTYRAITFTHLTKRHGFEGEHPIEDYKKRFGLDVAVCRDTRRTMRRQREDFWGRHGQRWTRERVLKTLRERAQKGEPLSSGSLDVPLSLAIRRRFGTWDKAMGRAGLDPEAHRLLHTWTERDLAAAVLDLAAKGEPISSSYVEQHHPGLHSAACRLLGNWGKTLRAAGLDPKAHRETRVWNLDRVKSWVRSAHAAGRSILSGRVPSGAHACAARETDMTWVEFVESLGIPYPGAHKRQDWTDEKVLEEIRDRRRRGLALNLQAVQSEGQALTHQARNRFGSWDGALRAAGIAPESVRLSRPWTRADVVSAILKRHAEGRPMDYASAHREDPRLVSSAQRLFPSSWGRALAAAGLPRELACGGR